MTKQVLLINPLRPEPKTGEISIPMGIMHVGTYLHSNGYNVTVIDVNNIGLKQLHKYIDTNYNNLLCVGISVMTVQIKNALEISRYIKLKNELIPIIWGGIHPTLYPEQTVKDLNVDFVVIGEGEHPSLELVKCIEHNELPDNIKGIAYTINNKVIVNPKRELINIDEVPAVNWNLLYGIKDIKSIVGKTQYFGGIPVQTSRGCPYKCSFCINAISKDKYRTKNIDLVLDEILSLYKQSINKIFILDENFFVNKKRVNYFIDKINTNGYKFEWCANARADYFNANYLNKALLTKLKRSGLKIIATGAESGSQYILDKLNKEITVDNIINEAKLLNECGIIGNFSFIIGLPNETQSDMLKTMQLIEQIKNTNSSFNFNGPQIYRPYPGSPLYDECVKLGMKEPQTLSEWSNSPYINDRVTIKEQKYFPWMSNMKETLSIIKTVDRMIFYKSACNFNSKIGVVNKLINTLASIRCSKSFYSLPIEKVIYDCFKGNIVGKILSKGSVTKL